MQSHSARVHVSKAIWLSQNWLLAGLCACCCLRATSTFLLSFAQRMLRSIPHDHLAGAFASATPIMLSLVTNCCSCSCVQSSVPVGLCGKTMYLQTGDSSALGCEHLVCYKQPCVLPASQRMHAVDVLDTCLSTFCCARTKILQQGCLTGCRATLTHTLTCRQMSRQQAGPDNSNAGCTGTQNSMQ